MKKFILILLLISNICIANAFESFELNSESALLLGSPEVHAFLKKINDVYHMQPLVKYIHSKQISATETKVCLSIYYNPQNIPLATITSTIEKSDPVRMKTFATSFGSDQTLRNSCEKFFNE